MTKSKEPKTIEKKTDVRTATAQQQIIIDVDQEPDEKTRREQQAALEFYSKKKEVQKKPPPQRTVRTRRLLPCPHVVPSSETSDHAVEVTWQSRQPTPLIEPVDDIKLISSGIEYQSDTIALDTLLQTALTKVLVPTSSMVRREHNYFSEQHYHSIDSDTEYQLKSFIERFKVRRQAAIERAAKRHEKLNGPTKRLKKKRKSKRRTFGDDDDESEDDLWEDEDDQARAEATLCLLTGPVGCAKSSTVHRVAADTGCETVLELYPGQARGGAQLRKLLEESTQSHSSKDMFQKRKASSALVNSDDEGEESSRSSGSAVTVILLDEADIVFDSDTGFWSTVMELAIKSKSPIVLTANAIPMGLTSAFTHIQMNRPSMQECTSWFETVAVDAGYRVRGSLETIALLARCDMRRMLFALEVFSLQQAEPHDNAIIGEEEEEEVVVVSRDKAELVELEAVVVESVEPRSILADEQTILTVKGRNFHRLISEPRDESGGFPCQVFLGEDTSLSACVVDESTIMAVFIPYKLPSFLDKTGLYKGTRKRSLAAAHPHITVGSVRASTAENRVIQWEEPTGEQLLRCAPHCTLDLQFPGSLPHAYSPVRRNKKTEDDDDDGEVEFMFTEESPTAVASTVGLYATRRSSVSDDSATSLLRERVLTVQASDDVDVLDAYPTSGDCSIETLTELERTCELLSDAALLHDHEEVPILAGACRGFGYAFTEEKRSNDKNKPYVVVPYTSWHGANFFHRVPFRPSEEFLFANGYKESSYFFGDPEAYMVKPVSTLERSLLKETDRFSTTAAIVEGQMSSKEQEESDPYFFYQEWDDTFLPGKRPGALAGLAIVPQDKTTSWTQTLREHKELLLRKKLRRSEWSSFLEFQLHAGDYNVRYYLRFHSIERAGDPLVQNLSPTVTSNMAVLDYLPLLRCMVVHDKVHRAFASPTKTTSRTTRRSRRDAACPYLELLLPDYVRNTCEESELAAMEEMLLRSSLLSC